MSVKSEIRVLQAQKEELEDQIEVLKLKIINVVETLQRIPSIENIAKTFERANLITTGYRDMLKSIPDHSSAFASMDARTLTNLRDATRELVKLKASI